MAPMTTQCANSLNMCLYGKKGEKRTMALRMISWCSKLKLSTNPSSAGTARIPKDGKASGIPRMGAGRKRIQR